MNWVKQQIEKCKKELYHVINTHGNAKQCYLCKNTFFRYYKFMGGTKYLSSWYKNTHMIGSDIDNYYCPYCACHDRERHLTAYFDKLDLWPKENTKILHFSPEFNFSKKIELYHPLEYIKADLNPEQYIEPGILDVKQINLMEIPYDAQHFDMVICNHVLEHVPDMKQCLSEIYRVLKEGGIAILQTPFSKLFHRHFEDSAIITDEQRAFFYLQTDHVRIVSERQFIEELKEAGFQLAFIKHKELFDSNFATLYGVNPEEDLIKVVKPNPLSQNPQ